MRIKRKVFYAFIIFIFVGSSYCVNLASAPLSTPKTQWINLYSQDNWTDESPRLIHIDNAVYYLVGQSSFRTSETTFDYKLWIWKLDSAGNRLWSKPIILPNIKQSEEIIWGNILCLKNERLIIACESAPKTGTWLMRFDENGSITFVKELSLGRYSYVLRNVAKTNDGLLISGQKIADEIDAWVLKIDFNGNVLWQRSYDNGKDEDAISMAVAEDGSFTLAADSGKYNKFGAGESKVWIVKCDGRGDVLTETTFLGRHPTIAMSTRGTYAISYNVADFPLLELHVLGLDKNLSEIWRTEALYKGLGIGMYKIAADSKDSFIIAGSKFDDLWLWKIDEKGKQLWSTSVNNREGVVVVESILINDKEYILTGSTVTVTTPPLDENNKLKKNEQWDLSDILIAKVAETASN